MRLIETIKGSIIILVLLSSLPSYSQIKFQKVFGGPILDWSNSMVQLSDSNYLILGSTKNFGSGGQDLYLIKTNQNGDTLWSKTFGGSTGDEEGNTIRQTSDGGFVVAGTTWSFGAGGDDIFLLKLDSNGDALWFKTYGGINVDFCTGMQTCVDGGYIISGYTTSFSSGSFDTYLIRTNDSGDTLWTKSFGNNNMDQAFAVVQTADSGFAVAGNAGLAGTEDVSLIRTDAQGNLLWAKTYGGAGEDIGYSLAINSDGSFCIGGSTTSFGAGLMDAFLIKTDAGGDTLWSRTFGSSDSDGCFSVLPTDDAGYILTGFANKATASDDDVLLIKTDANGNMTWNQTMGGTTNARDEGRHIISTLDRGYLIGGFSQSFGGGTELYLIKTDSAGNSGCNHLVSLITENTIAPVVASAAPLTTGGSITSTPTIIQGSAPANETVLCFTVGVEYMHPEYNASINIYPMPFHDYADVTISAKGVDNIIFKLVNVQGAEVQSMQVNMNGDASSFRLDRKNLSPGMYFYSISTMRSGELIGSGKVVIE